jgi:phosphodiesterase/alkaline phosphatase D-like protein
VLNAAGTALDYSTYIGANNGSALATGVAVDSAGTAYVAGLNQPTGRPFPTTADALPSPTGPASADAFLSVLHPGASSYTYSTLFGGAESDLASAIALDPAGDVFLTGRAGSPGLSTAGVLKPALSGTADAFVARFDATVPPPPPTAPTVASGAASAVTGSSASVAGSVDPNRLATSYVFEYGTSTAFGSISAPAGAGAGTSDVPVSASLAGLAAGTTYYYRVVATSSAGTAFGVVRSFKTAGGSAVAPAAITQPATLQGTTAARLSGQVNPNGSPTAYTFEYGTSTSFGSITPVVQLDDASALESVSANLTALAPDTTYYYRVVAGNAAGTTVGAVQRFDTGPGGAPIVTTGAASEITATTAKLSGTVDAHGLQTAFTFAYGPTTAPLSQISAVDNAGTLQGAQAVTLPLTGLTPNTTYVYRMVATNSAGSSIATVRSFTTANGT